MRKTCIILFGFLLFESLAFGQQATRNDINEFNSFLGEEKANALNAAVESLDQFLSTNYSNLNSYSSRTRAFLEQMYNLNEPDSMWKFETEKNLKIIEAFGTSGLRKEIWLYDDEKYDSKYNIQEFLKPRDHDSLPITDLGKLNLELIESEIIPLYDIDSVESAKFYKDMEERNKTSPWTNINGQFLYGLAKYTLSDSLIQEYVESYGSVMSPAVIAYSFLERDINYDDPFVKRIIVYQFYYRIMERDIRRKEIK